MPVDSPDPLRAALRTELADADPLRGPVTDSARTNPGTILWSEAFDGDWRAQAGGERLDHVEPFGLTNGFVLPERASVSITYEGQTRRYVMIAVQATLWLGLALAWWYFRGYDDRERDYRGGRRA